MESVLTHPSSKSVFSSNIVVTPTTSIPAANAAATPDRVSSKAKQFDGETPILWAAVKKISGWGFPCSTSWPPVVE